MIRVLVAVVVLFSVVIGYAAGQPAEPGSTPAPPAEPLDEMVADLRTRVRNLMTERENLRERITLAAADLSALAAAEKERQAAAAEEARRRELRRAPAKTVFG